MNSTLPGRLVAGGLLVLVAAGLSAAPLAFGTPPTVLPFDISGQWKGSAKANGVSGGVTFFLLQEGSDVSGTVKVKSSFINDCDPVTGTILPPSAFQDSTFAVNMETPHVNPFTCAIVPPPDTSQVDMLLSSNIKMEGEFEFFVPELNGGQNVLVHLSLKKKSGLITEDDPDGPGPAVPLDSPLPGVHDLAVTKLVVPKTVTLTATKPSVTTQVKVEIQNRSQHDETITDTTVLDDLVTLTCTPLGSCTPPVPVLVVGKPQKTLPFLLKSKKKMTVFYEVTFDCAFDPAKTVGQSFHGDYTWTAEVDHEALGAPDDHEADDVCPRNAAAPYDFDHYPDGTIKDKGCGAKLPDKTFGGTVVTDVVVK